MQEYVCRIVVTLNQRPFKQFSYSYGISALTILFEHRAIGILFHSLLAECYGIVQGHTVSIYPVRYRQSQRKFDYAHHREVPIAVDRYGVFAIDNDRDTYTGIFPFDILVQSILYRLVSTRRKQAI